MTNEDVRRRFREELNAREQESWPARGGGSVSRYAWRRWFAHTPAGADRLLAELSNAPAERLIGGTRRLSDNCRAALARLGGEAPSRLTHRGADPAPGPLPADARLGQLTCDRESRARVVDLLVDDFPYGARVLFLGDDDLISVGASASGFDVTVIDVDDRLAPILSGRPRLAFRLADVRDELALGLFDAVVLDPADGSVALEAWLAQAHTCLSPTPGSRIYLSVNMHRLARRWAAVLHTLAHHDVVPVRASPSIKSYPQPAGGPATTDLWTFERMPMPSALPLPYLDVELVR